MIYDRNKKYMTKTPEIRRFRLKILKECDIKYGEIKCLQFKSLRFKLKYICMWHKASALRDKPHSSQQ